MQAKQFKELISPNKASAISTHLQKRNPQVHRNRNFNIINKFNPYHGKDGRFTSSRSAASFTYKPGASTAHSKAIEREKEKDSQEGKGFKGTLYHGSPSTDIKEFDMKRAGQNTSSGEKLLFFTDSKQMADDFSYERLDGSSKFFQERGKKGRVYEVDVEMKNPLDLRKLNDKDIDNILKLDEEGILTRADVKEYASKNHQLLKAGLTLTSDSLKNLGYDGLIANTGKAGHNSIEYAVVDSKQAKIKKGIDCGGESLNGEINKADKEKYALYIGLNVTGAEHLAIDGGEDPKDFHVTLLYGYYHPVSDVEDTAMRIQSCREKAVKYLPDTLKLDKIGRFEASSSSDDKDVIYARVAPGQLEKAHDILLKELNDRGLKVQPTFDEYNPHMTLAYIDPDEEVELKDIDETVTIKNLTEGFETDEASSKENENTFKIAKTDDDKRLVFGWALVAKDKDGNVIKDHQNDMIDEDDLEEGAYEYVLNFRDSGEEHIPGLRKKARMVESCVFTEEKQKALGIPEGTVPTGWWIGFYVDDDKAWEKIKDGTYKMFSIEGKAIRVPVDEVQTTDTLAKSFTDLLKYNKWHGKDGRFTSGPGGGSGASSASQIAYEYDEKAGVDYGNFPDEQQAAVSRWTFSAEGIRNPETEQEKKDAKALENYITEGKNDITEKIYRGIVMSNEDYNALASAAFSQENIDQKGLSSWSSDKSLASSFGGIHGGKGTEREGVRSVVFVADGFKKGSARYLPSHYGEDEVLVSANTKLKITKIKYDRDINATFVHVQDVAKSDNVAKTFAEILKFNPYHDRLGRFTSGGGFMASGYTGDKNRQAVTFSANPDTKAGAMAIERARGHHP